MSKPGRTTAQVATRNHPQKRTRPGMLLPLLFLACGNAIDHDIDSAMAGGESGERALMQLSLSSADVTPALTAAAADTSNPAGGRVTMIELLRRIFVREADRRILEGLEAIAVDRDETVRKSVIRTLGDIGQTRQLFWLIGHLSTESDEDVLREALLAVQNLEDWRITKRGNSFWVADGESLSSDQTTSLRRVLKGIFLGTASDSLRIVTEELIERMACQMVQDAEERELAADLDAADLIFRRAQDFAPESRNVNRRYGLFLLRNGYPERSKALLAAHEVMIGVPHRNHAPVLDGVLDEPFWQNAGHIGRHQKTLKLMRSQPDDSQSHAYFAYTDSALYMGMVRYHVDVEKLRSEYRDHDGRIWEDDHFSLGLKTGLHENLEYAYYVNALGTVYDSADGTPDAPGAAWNGEQRAATFTGTDHWSMELALPFRAFIDKPHAKKGDMWLLCSGWGETATSKGAAWIGSHGIPSGNLDGLAVFE
jgi:hypothetical protein